MGGKDGEAGVLERDQRHQDVVGPAARPDLALVGQRGLVAVVAVGDQQLAVGELRGDRLVHPGVADPPDTVGGALVIGDLVPRVLEGGADVPPGVAGMEREDRGEVVPGGSGEAEAVLLRPRLGALVGADALAVGSEPDPGEEAPAGEATAVGGVVVLLQRPDRRLVVFDQDALVLPGAEQTRRVLVRVVSTGIPREVDLDDVVSGAARELRPLLIIDHVVRRRGDRRQRSHLAEVVVQSPQWFDPSHRGGTLDSFRSGRGAAW